jgi:hypothetical protein
MFSQLRKNEDWLSSLRKDGDIYTQELNSRDLVTLEELCEILGIHPLPVVPSTHGGFNNTYFTHHKTSGQELAIRVSKEPVAAYTYSRGETTQVNLRASTVGVNDRNMKQIHTKRGRDREKEGERERERMPPKKTPKYEINWEDFPGGDELNRPLQRWAIFSKKLVEPMHRPC